MTAKILIAAAAIATLQPAKNFLTTRDVVIPIGNPHAVSDSDLPMNFDPYTYARASKSKGVHIHTRKTK